MKLALVARRRLASLLGGAFTTGSGTREVAVIRPEDWAGCDTSGTHDNASIFRSMGAQIPSTGGIISLPAGRIATSAACPLPSLTTVAGQGEATEIICLPSFAPNWTVAPRAAFINRAWATGGGEVGITIRDLRMTGNAGPTWGDAHFINMLGVRRVRVDRVTSFGWGNCTAFAGCQDTDVCNCIAENVSNCAFDHWGGAGWMRVTNSFASVCAGAAGSFGIMVTGLKTDGSPGESAHAIILGNQVHVIGGTDPVRLGSCIEVNAGDDTGDSAVADAIIGENICVVSKDSTHRGIHLAQAVRGAQVRGNILRGGRFGPAITATGPNRDVVARDCVVEGNIIIDWLPTPSQGSAIAWWGMSSTITNNRGRNVPHPFVNLATIDPSNQLVGNFAA
jgi:hypothetical protein